MQARWFQRLLVALVVGAMVATAFAPLVAAPAAKSARAFLGVAVGPNEGDKAGAMIHDVTADSPAAKAGLKKGDVILKLDDKDVKAADAVVEMVRHHKAGDKVKVQVMRDGKEQTIEVTLGEKLVAAQPMPVLPSPNRPAFLGVWTHALTAELKKQLGVEVEKGAVVTDVMPNSPAEKAGLKKDDVITTVNGQAIANPEELRTTVQKLETGKDATLSVLRGKETREFKVHLQAGPLSFDFENHFPMLKDGTFKFEKFPAGNEDMQKLFEELQKRIRELEQQPKPPVDRSL